MYSPVGRVSLLRHKSRLFQSLVSRSVSSGMSSAAAPKHEWLVIMPDCEGALEKRLSVRATYCQFNTGESSCDMCIVIVKSWLVLYAQRRVRCWGDTWYYHDRRLGAALSENCLFGTGKPQYWPQCGSLGITAPHLLGQEANIKKNYIPFLNKMCIINLNFLFFIWCI